MPADSSFLFFSKSFLTNRGLIFRETGPLTAAKVLARRQIVLTLMYLILQFYARPIQSKTSPGVEALANSDSRES